MNTKILLVASVLFGFITQTGCYSLSGISIDPNSKTFHVSLFENRADLIEPTFARDFSEKLKDKIRTSTRLVQDDREGDIEFTGTITQFQITSEAPQPGATTAINRLRVSVKIDFSNQKNEKDKWSQSFNDFVDFGANENFANVKTEKMDEVIKNLVEKIFNEAFAKNW